MALYHYFQTVDALPAPVANGPLSAFVSHLAIMDANEAIRRALILQKSKGTYAKLTPEQQAVIGMNALLHRKQACVRIFF